MADFKHIRGVIFDMDGLMLDTERLFRQAYQQAAMEVGVDFPDALYASMVGRRADTSQRILREGLGPDAPHEDIIEGARRHYYTLLEKGGVPIRPGLLITLNYLDEVEMPRAVATSTHSGLTASKLTGSGLIKYFTVVVSGDQVEHGKPAPDIYLRAAELMGVEPEHCVVLEDSAAGLEGSHRAGMMPVLIPDLLEPTAAMQEHAAHIFPSLTEFAAAFRRERES
ncbi:MAG: HAD family hydrolase [Puniceicoccales bacterium]